MKTSERVRLRMREGAFVKLRFAHECAGALAEICDVVIRALRRDRSVWLLGNGGSAADAQHIAAELQGRFYRNRRPLPVAALTTDTSTLTAIGNDLGYALTFSRQVEAHARAGDVVIAISTSGRSPNVLRAVAAARKKRATVVGFTGRTGGALRRRVDYCLSAPSDDVARIQECHTLAGHILCEAVEAALFR
jgi:D-sedoheptulose 7-phosphate isomerase